MYCMKCGMELNEKARFCSYCGCPVQGYSGVGAGMQYVQNTGGNLDVRRMEILHKLDKALPIYQFVAEKDCIIQNLDESILMQKRKKGHNGGAVALGLFIMLIMLIIIWVFPPENELITVLISIGSFVPLILMIILDNWKKEKEIKATEKVKIGIQQEIAEYMKANNIPELYILPEKYRYFIAAQYIRECLMNQRAQDLPGAINLYEEQMHRWKMENYQYHMYVQSMQKRVTSIMIF